MSDGGQLLSNPLASRDESWCGESAEAAADGEPTAATATTAATAAPQLTNRWLAGQCCGATCCLVLLPMLLLMIFAIMGVVSGSSDPTKVKLQRLGAVDNQAVCNDGSEAAYYWAEATDPQKARLFVVWLEGGDQCESEQTCRERMVDNPGLMSSKTWQAERSLDGVLSTGDPTFGGANIVQVAYCSSDNHGGDRNASAATFGWHFRGRRIVQAVLKDLVARHGLHAGDKLVLAGCSAGADGVAILCDFVPDWIPSGVKLSCLMDSPINELDVPVKVPYTTPEGHVRVPIGESQLYQIQPLMELMNISILPACAATFPKEERWKCVWAQFNIQYLQTPYFMNNNRFDMFGATMAVDFPTLVLDTMNFLSPFSDDAMNEWGEQMGAVTAPLPTAAQPRSAVFQAGCCMHCGMGMGLYEHVSAGADNILMRDAIAKWFVQLDSSAVLSRAELRWVSTGDLLAADGACFGFADAWVSVFRAMFFVWCVWLVQLAQRYRQRREVNHVMEAMVAKAEGAIANARGKAGRAEPELAPHWRVRVGWVCMWFVWFVLCLVGRNI